MTEDEAKTKWCPFARVTDVISSGGGNRWDGGGNPYGAPIGYLCIGSACMAWRWINSNAQGFTDYRVNGYCGLAGKP